MRPMIVGGLTVIASVSIALPAAAQEACFVRLDTGVDMTGWSKSTTNHHGPGDGWTFENGDLVGRQTGAQLGGILMTAKTFKDVEVTFEVKIDWGCDSGFFFRVTGGDRAYQMNIDHLDGAGIGTLYGEMFTTEWRVRPYLLSNNGTIATKDPISPYTPIFDLTRWSTIWNPTGYNQMRARVEGNPPHIQAWIGNTKVMDVSDTQLRSEVNASGPLAIQVHGGGRWTPGGAVRFRNIWAKDLTVPCTDGGGVAEAGVPQPDGGAGGSAGAGGNTIAAGGSAGAGGDTIAAGGSAGAGGDTIAAGGSAGTGGVGGSAGADAGSSATPTDGGCACSAAPARSGSAAFALLAALGAIAAGRRRA